MQTKLTESTVTRPLGRHHSRKLFEITAGEHAGRRVALIQTAPTDIYLTHADPPYTVWSAPQSLITDAADLGFAAAIGPNGDLYVVYVEQSAYNLIHLPVQFSGGVWAPQTPVTVYNGGNCSEPSLAIDDDARLWLAYRVLSAPTFTVYAKYSDDTGATWSGGVSAPGDAIAGPDANLQAKIICHHGSAHIAYAIATNKLALRSLPTGASQWSAEQIIASGGLHNEHFDIAVRPDSLIAVVWTDNGLHYREYNGVRWEDIVTIDTGDFAQPSIRFHDNNPVIAAAAIIAGNQRRPVYTMRVGGSFTTPAPLQPAANYFDSVQLYHAAADTLSDQTAAAQSTTSADITHPDSGALVAAIDDAIYLGHNTPFRYIQLLLSTPGVGGQIEWSYYNGTAWQTVTPHSGANHLTDATERVLLFEDLQSIPSDWQQSTLNNVTAYWLRARVTTAFTTPPVGSMITAVSEISSLNLMR